MSQAPVPAGEGAGRGNVAAVPNHEVPQVLGEFFGAVETKLGFRRITPEVGAGGGPLEGVAIDLATGVDAEGGQVLRLEVFLLIVADDDYDVGLPVVEFVVEYLE